MDLHLTVDSYFEYFLTVFGWVIGNNIWDLLIDTGLFAAPFVAHIISSFLKVREQGDDEGNKGRLLVAWLENKLYLSFIIMMMCCVPLFNVSFSTLKFDTARMKECKTTQLAPEQTGLGNLSTELNGQSARLPLWWAFTYAASKGLTHGAIASIPCKPDLRQIRFEVQSTQIKDQFLRRELNDFVSSCFLPARAKLNNFGTMAAFDDAQADDISWIGSRILVNAPGLYDSFYAKSPNKHFPWNPNKRPRDANMPRDLGGGFPQCKEWWTDSNSGLRSRLLNTLNRDMFNQLDKRFYNEERYGSYDDKLIRGLLSVQDVKGSEKTYNAYGSKRNLQVGSVTDWNVSDLYNGLAGTFGKVVGGALTSPAFDIVKQSLPYIQSLILFVFALAMPLIVVFSGYSVKAMMAMTFWWFSIFFLTFIWEVAHWLDTSIYTALYGDDILDSILQTSEGFTMNLVLNTMYLVIPALWVGFLSWAGIKAGSGIDGAIKGGSDNAKSATEKSINNTQRKI